MSPGHIFSTLLAAGILTAAIAIFLSPKLEEQTAPSTKAPVANSAVVETSQPEQASRRIATLRVRPDGHYWVRALVNRRASVEFMVDTGASVVALTRKDALKMGFNPNQLDYKWEIRTAGGITRGASIVIDSIKINQVHIRNVEAMVLETDLEQSLLGMSFLRELYSYEFRGERMIIKQ